MESINRIIDVFPSHQQAQVRAQLSFVLEGVVTQTLLQKAKGRGRVMACEILIMTPAVRALIRDEKIEQIPSMMQAGKKHGMQTLNDALYQLYVSREVTKDECLRVTSTPNEFLRMIRRGAGRREGAESVRRAARRRRVQSGGAPLGAPEGVSYAGLPVHRPHAQGRSRQRQDRPADTRRRHRAPAQETVWSSCRSAPRPRSSSSTSSSAAGSRPATSSCSPASSPP